MLARLLQNLSIYLGDDYEVELFTLLCNQVIAKVKFYRNYTDDYDDDMIEEDIEKYEAQIFDIVIKLYNRMGIEGEKTHSENNTSTTLVDDAQLYDFITPIARLL